METPSDEQTPKAVKSSLASGNGAEFIQQPDFSAQEGGLATGQSTLMATTQPIRTKETRKNLVYQNTEIKVLQTMTQDDTQSENSNVSQDNLNMQNIEGKRQLRQQQTTQLEETKNDFGYERNNGDSDDVIQDISQEDARTVQNCEQQHQRPETEMSHGGATDDKRSQETTLQQRHQIDDAFSRDINHAISYELKHAGTRARASLCHNHQQQASQLRAVAGANDTQRTSSNTMLFDQNLMSGFKPIDSSFEPSFNISGSVQVTDQAPSEKAFITIEQQGVQMISISSESAARSRQHNEQDHSQLNQENNNDECNYIDIRGQSPQIGVQINDSMNSSSAIAKSQEEISPKKLIIQQQQLSSGLACDNPSDNKVLIAAASEQTENNAVDYQHGVGSKAQSLHLVIKKDSVHGISSDNSLYQNTRSAVDKGNLEQRCTDPSEGRANQENYSQDSQYYQQIEEVVEDQDQISISKQVILEQEEYYNNNKSSPENVNQVTAAVNADIIHLTSGDKQSLTADNAITGSGAGAAIVDEELIERSKESTENGGQLPVAQQHQLQATPEYFRSMEQIIPHQRAIDPEVQEPFVGDASEVQPQRQSLRNVTTYNPNDLIEMTPQFHGSSPVILDAQLFQQADENNDNLVDNSNDVEEYDRQSGDGNNQHHQQRHQPQPNYESDTAGAERLSGADGCMGQGAVARQSDSSQVQMAPSPYASGADVVINTADGGTTSNQNNNDYGGRDSFELQRSLNILPGSDQYDPRKFQSSSGEEANTDSKTAKTNQVLQDDGLIKIITNIQIQCNEETTEDENQNKGIAAIGQQNQEVAAVEIVRDPSSQATQITTTHFNGRSAKSLGQVECSNRYKIVEHREKTKKNNLNELSCEVYQTHRESSKKFLLLDKGQTRGSSRLCKGQPDLLDHVAERINNSLILNSQSNCDDNMPVYLEREPSLEQADQDALKISNESSVANLPKSILNPVINNEEQQQQPRQSQQQQHPTLTNPTEMTYRPSSKLEQDKQIHIRQQDTPSTPSRVIKGSGIHSRKSSRMMEPRFPEPVDEAKQRFSTPRRRSKGSFSPIGSCSGASPSALLNQSKLDKLSKRSVSNARGKLEYPVVVRKNQVIRGPVLRSNYDNCTIQNGKLKMAFRRRRKTTQQQQKDKNKPSSQDSGGNLKKEEGDNSQKNNTTMESRGFGTQRPSQQTARSDLPQTFHSKKRSVKAAPSESLDPTKSASIPAITKNQKQSRQQENHKSSPIRQHLRLNARLNLLNAKKDITSGSSLTRATKRRDLPASKTPNTFISVFNSSRQPPSTNQQRSSENLLPAELTPNQCPSNDVSINSGIYSSATGGNNSFIFKKPPSSHFADEKFTPRCPPTNQAKATVQQQQPMLDNSTFYSGHDSSFAGISRYAVDNLPVDKLYEMMSKNWNREKIAFELKCKKLLDDTSSQTGTGAPSSQTLSSRHNPNEQQHLAAVAEMARDRQHRFELLRQRLLNRESSSLKKQRNSSMNETSTFSSNNQPQQQNQQMLSLTHDQAILNENLREIEESFNQSQELNSYKKMGKNKPPTLQYGQFQFIFNSKPVPHEFKMPSSPSSHTNNVNLNIASNSKRSYPSGLAHQSQNQLLLRQNNNLPNTFFVNSSNHDQNRQKSQVLTPAAKLMMKQGQDKTILAMNITPEGQQHINKKDHMIKTARSSNLQCNKNRKTSEPYAQPVPNSPHLLLQQNAINAQPKSVRLALNIQQEYNATPQQYANASAANSGSALVRAATANNQVSQRPAPVLTDAAFKSSVSSKGINHHHFRPSRGVNAAHYTTGFTTTSGESGNSIIRQQDYRRKIITIHKSSHNQNQRTEASPNPSNTSGNGGNTSADEQVRLMQKLQYRSMRGRRIKDYLEKVQSEKQAAASRQDQGEITLNQPTINMYYPMNNATQQQISIIDSHLSEDQNTTLRKQTGTQVHSTSSFQNQNQQLYNNEGGYGSNPSLPTKSKQQQNQQNKLKNSLGPSDDGSSLNEIDSRNDIRKAKCIFNAGNCSTAKSNSQYSEEIIICNQAANTFSQKTSSNILLTSNGNNMPTVNQSYEKNQTAVLNNFLAQQDKRIDFGLCPLFKKVKDGLSLELQSPRQHQHQKSKDSETSGSTSQKILKLAEIESLMSFIKRKNLQTSTRPFQLKAHQECFNTIEKIMSELGMGYRAQRMQRDESQITIERIYVLACRAHKLYRARIELVQIFDQIIQLEEILPQVKQQLLSKLSESDALLLAASAAASVQSSSKNNEHHTEGSVILENDTLNQLQNSATQLKALLSQLVVAIPQLLTSFKFFNDTFVYNDKDYLKYLSKEANEIKGLFGVYNIKF